MAVCLRSCFHLAIDFPRERVVSGKMSVNSLLPSDILPEELREHSLITVSKSRFPHSRPTVDGQALVDGLFAIFEEIPPLQAKILVDLGGFEQFDMKGFNALKTSLEKGSEIVLTNASQRIKQTLEDLGLVQNESNSTGFRIVDLSATGSVAKEK